MSEEACRSNAHSYVYVYYIYTTPGLLYMSRYLHTCTGMCIATFTAVLFFVSCPSLFCLYRARRVLRRWLVQQSNACSDIVVSVVATGKIRAVLTIHASETPVRTELRCYFRELLKSRSEQQSTRCCRIELSCAAGVMLTIMKL